MHAPDSAGAPPPARPAIDEALLQVDLSSLDTTARLRWAWEAFGARAGIGTSFQGAGLVTIHLALTAGLKFPVFTLDTGLLFPETLDTWRRLESFFGITIEGLTPALTVEVQAQAIGPELWKTDPDFCCTLRKVEPLKDKLAHLDCWITGLRRDQSQVRNRTDLLEEHLLESNDPSEGAAARLWKLNPVADWSRDQVWDYIKKHGIPYNPLHDRGYRSIGCMPCTHAVSEGADERAGRWTGFKKTECGIHTFTKKAAKPLPTTEPGPEI